VAEAQPIPPFYTGALNAETYDLGIGRGGPGTSDDVAFYLDLARSAGSTRGAGPTRAAGARVLELASGTGRVSIPLAEAGLEVTGLERSSGMLLEAARKRDALDPSVRDRLRFVAGDMSAFDLGTRFDLVIIPFRSFAFLLEPEAQRACLRAAFAHLRPGGTFSLQVFDPLLDLCVPGVGGRRSDDGLDPRTGRTVRVDVLDRTNDPLRQVLRETWRFAELDRDGRVIREETEALVLRWTYRYEMRYLLELVGFEAIEEWSDFHRSPPAYGREQVWVARRRAASDPAESRQGSDGARTS
jgi:SAM-dependent methyltransferase